MRRKRKKKSFMNRLVFFMILLTVFLGGLKVYNQHLQTVKGITIASDSEIEEVIKVVEEQPLVVIDAGHGGIDPGSDNKGFLEKDINLQISLKLQQALLDKGYRVLMTRSDDTALELTERSDFANEVEADLFISIHQNCYLQDSSVSGIEVYYNDDKITNDEVFAQSIQQSLVASTGARDRGIREEASLVVTRETKMPAVLIETAFISSDRELSLITSDDYQTQVVEGIVMGIENFLNDLNN